MTRKLARLREARRAVAALEFALIMPFLLILLGGLTDFGFALWDKAKLADAVAIGAQYAYLNKTTPLSILAASVSALVSTVPGLSDVTPSVKSYTGSCLNGTQPPAPPNPGPNCADGTSPGTYLAISASYSYPAILPAYSMLVGKTLSESVTVRIQ